MFKISIIDTRAQRRLVLEGKLVAPWTGELQSAWKSAGHELQGRKLVIDLTNITVIGQDGENMLFELMKDGARFSCGGVLTKHVVKRLSRRCR
jgi:anti-anti-sigma regulatory factor